MSLMFTRKIQMSIIVAFLIIVGAGIFVYFFKSKNIPKQPIIGGLTSDSFDSAKNNTENKQNNKPSFEAPPTPVQSIKTPSLSRPIAVPDPFGVEGKVLILGRFMKVIDVLQKNPESMEDWLSLGILRNQINDFVGAKEVWEYLIAVFPKNPIAYGNLANLYVFDLKDPVKAEATFKKAIEVGPDQIQVYGNFSEFYRFVLKNDEKAKAVLKIGIEKNPMNSGNLQKMLESYGKL